MLQLGKYQMTLVWAMPHEPPWPGICYVFHTLRKQKHSWRRWGQPWPAHPPLEISYSKYLGSLLALVLTLSWPRIQKVSEWAVSSYQWPITIWEFHVSLTIFEVSEVDLGLQGEVPKLNLMSTSTSSFNLYAFQTHLYDTRSQILFFLHVDTTYVKL